MRSYFDHLCDAMSLCSSAHPRVLFMGQAVACPGTAMRRTLEHIPEEQLLELPVFEDTQMGMAIGYALDGGLPICIYPRYNFLLLAMSQLVLHLDKLPFYSQRRYRPKVIIRTAIGSEQPLYPGAQHVGDFTTGLREMLRNVDIVNLYTPKSIMREYKIALSSQRSTILVENAGMY